LLTPYKKQLRSHTNPASSERGKQVLPVPIEVGKYVPANDHSMKAIRSALTGARRVSVGHSGTADASAPQTSTNSASNARASAPATNSGQKRMSSLVPVMIPATASASKAAQGSKRPAATELDQPDWTTEQAAEEDAYAPSPIAAPVKRNRKVLVFAVFTILSLVIFTCLQWVSDC
jgi:hypothetical protein